MYDEDETHSNDPAPSPEQDTLGVTCTVVVSDEQGNVWFRQVVRGGDLRNVTSEMHYDSYYLRIPKAD